jgi:DHA2 family methylenomycin A resistance protein-like MFS transporter
MIDGRTDLGSRSGRRWALVATSLGFGVVQLDVTVVNVAIRPIGDALGGDVAGLQWVVNAYTLGLAALILSAGALGDRLGARRVFVGGFVLFTLASAACGLAPDLGTLIAARAVQGVGAAVLIPCSLTLLNHAHPDAAGRARAVGIWAACASVALSGGPIVGALLIDALGWRAIFFINAPLGALGILLTLRHAVETPRTPRRFDPPGQALAALALFALAWATVTGGQRGFGAPPVLVGYAVAALALGGFLLAERRGREPMLPLGLFGSRTFAASAAIGLLVNTAFYGLIFVLSLYFQAVRGWSVLATGAAFLPATAAVLAGNLLAGRLAAASSPRTVLAGSALLVAGSVAGLLVAGPDTGYAALVAQLVVLGFGLGALVPTMTSALLGSVEPTRSGVASGTLNTARQVGSVLGVALFGSLATGDVVRGLHESLLVSVALALAAALLAGAVTGRA